MMRTRPQFSVHALMTMTTMTSIPGASKNGLTVLDFFFTSTPILVDALCGMVVFVGRLSRVGAQGGT